MLMLPHPNKLHKLRLLTICIAQLFGDTLPYVVVKIVVFIICVSFVKQHLVLKDSDN